jgi:phytanoyl-CoA hydroxylase
LPCVILAAAFLLLSDEPIDSSDLQGEMSAANTMQRIPDPRVRAIGHFLSRSIAVECERSYRERGFAVIEGFFSHEDLAPVIRELEREVDRRARELYRVGRLRDLFEDEPFEQRLARIYDGCQDVIDFFDIRDLLTPGLFGLLTSPKVLNLAQHLLGPDIVLNPTHRLRIKAPQAARIKWAEIETDSVPLYPIWHQDALGTDDADPFDMLSVWVPLVDATVENGCLAVMPDAFRLGRLAHRSDQGGRIRDDALPTVVPHPVPCPRLGIVIFNHFTPHCSLPNMTDGVRWSVDFRFHGPDRDTGRPGLPTFLVCKRDNPSALLVNYDEWRKTWIETLHAT